MKNLTKAIITLSAFTFSGMAAAESTTGTAQANLLETISFVENQIVDFKTIANVDGNCAMSAAGVLSGSCAGAPNGTPGQVTVSGTANQAVDVSVGSGTTDAGVTFNPLLASNGLAADSTTLDGSGDAVVNVIGSIDIASATAGL